MLRLDKVSKRTSDFKRDFSKKSKECCRSWLRRPESATMPLSCGFPSFEPNKFVMTVLDATTNHD